jgi:cysteine desulfurase family protein (TIGR01976 family)
VETTLVPGAGIDTGTIRSHFPALGRRAGRHAVAYFDGPGGTQVPGQVVAAVSEYLLHHNANTHWNYPTSAETDAILAAAREVVSEFLGSTPSEIAFGANMTTLTMHLARALGRGWSAGDEVVVTELDHHANIDPWKALASEVGIRVRMAAMDPVTGELDLDDLRQQITGTGRTRLVAIGAASNALGTINDVGTVIGLAKEAGALTFIDAVHWAPHVLPDVRALDCDFLACSAYKFYGPHLGILYGRLDRVEALDVPRLEPGPNEGAERLETGTQNHEGIAGAAAAVEFLASLSEGPTRRERLATTFDRLHEAGRARFRRMWDGLGEIEGVKRYGPPPDRPRTPTVAFTVAGVDSGDVAEKLGLDGVFVSHGDFYATTVVERLGLDAGGLVRAGCACYTTDDEVERLIEGVRGIAS